MTQVNLGRVAIVPQDLWVSSTTYKQLDMVSYFGASYLCKVLTTTKAPTTSSDWMVIARDGVQGATGETGAIGNAIQDFLLTNSGII